MNYIPSEMLRGHLDTIILLSLIDSDKHTNQIKEVIEKRSGGQFVLKQGTFYSCLQRITKQGFVTEYRTTDDDGVRRKFFQLTEKGKSYIDANKDSWVFSKHVLDLLISDEDVRNDSSSKVDSIKTEDKVEQTPTSSVSSVSADHDNNDLNDFLNKRKDEDAIEPLKSFNNDLSYIDFTQAETTFTDNDFNEKKRPDKFEQLTIKDNEPVTNEIVKKTDEQNAVDNVIVKNNKENVTEGQAVEKNDAVRKTVVVTEQNDDRLFTDDSTDYRSVLEKMFPSDGKHSQTSREMTYEEGVDVDSFFNDGKTVKKPITKHQTISKKTVKKSVLKTNVDTESVSDRVTEDNFYDFSDVLDLAAEEGFKIRISSKESKKDIGKILVNKLNLFSSMIFFSVILIETLIIYFTTGGVAETGFIPFLVFILVCSAFPIYNLILFCISPERKIRSLPSFKNSIELILIICLNLLLIDIVVCVLAAVDFSSAVELTRYIIYPILFIIDVPFYVIIKYLLLQKNTYYE